MKSIKVCEYSRSRSCNDDLILQDQASGERSQDQWSSVVFFCDLIPNFFPPFSSLSISLSSLSSCVFFPALAVWSHLFGLSVVAIQR